MEKLRRLVSGLKALRDAEPGKRFQAHYERAHDPHGNYGMRALLIVGGIGVAVVGFLLSLIPAVPGSAMSLIGAGLVAAESRTAACSLDWVEVKLRGAYRWVRDRLRT